MQNILSRSVEIPQNMAFVTITQSAFRGHLLQSEAELAEDEEKMCAECKEMSFSLHSAKIDR